MINKILIIEDEAPNANRLIRLIGELNPEIQVVGVLDSVSDSAAWFKINENPDLVLMDIRLSDGISFDIFDQVSVDCPVIFTTAYDEYALQAFKFNSVDYIIKPIEKDELGAALKKVNRINGMASSQQSIEQLLAYVKPQQYRSRFLIPYRDGFKTVLASDILFIYTELKITKARLKQGQDIVLNLSLDDLNGQLDPKVFFRASRQYIIHVESVKEIVYHFNRKLKVILAGDHGPEIILSREKSNMLKEWLDF